MGIGAAQAATPTTDANAALAAAIGLEENPALRALAFVMALASMAALAIVALPCIVLHSVALVLARIRPLHDAYRFVSAAYDRLIDRLAEKVLRDPRDAPALRLIVSLSLTALPILVAQVILGRPRPLLVVAFYLSLYGPKFQRFVRMFSAKHIEAHRRQGYFSGAYDMVLGRFVEFFLGYLYGNIPELDRTVHVRLHHKENGGPDDTRFPGNYDRTSRLDFFKYLSANIWTVLGLEPYVYFRVKRDEENRKRMLWGMVRFYVYFAALFIYDWRIGIWYALVPLFAMNFITAMTAWVQHAFHDPEHPEDYFANTVTVYDEVNFMNEGYHLSHHHRSSLHWSEMPAHHERLSDKMRESGSLVFRDMDFMGLFFELTLLRRMDVLAEKLVPWEPMTREDKLALIARRTKPAAVVANAALPVAPVSSHS